MMKIMNLTEGSKIYTSNVFFIMGEWNVIGDKNTLIDVGQDPDIINKINSINTGLGKNKIDQVIITHSHSDHTAILLKIKELFNPKIYAFNHNLKGVDNILKDADKIKIGDKEFEVFHITAHSFDSICLYCEDEGILFSGDTHFPIEFENDSLELENKKVIARLSEKIIKKVYPGHETAINYNENNFMLIKKN